MTKPVPRGAESCRLRKKPAVKWRTRGGFWIVAEIRPGGRCRYESPTYWVEWYDDAGRHREPVSANKSDAELRKSEIELRLRRERMGLEPTRRAPADISLTLLAEDYRGYLTDLGRSAKHVGQTLTQIGDLLEECGWIRARDVTPESWVKWAGAARRGQDDDGIAAETVNHYLRSVRGFLRWMVRTRHLPADPLASVSLLNAAADRRILRRVLSADQFRRLIDVTRASPKLRVYLDGPSRAALYLVAARTGLRAGVLAQLRPEDLRLDSETPHIPVEARRQKSRKELRVPLGSALLDELRGWLTDREPGHRLWPSNWHRHNKAADMLRRDLKAAGIPAKTADGSYDFHALRGQCATDLALAGVPLSVTQQFLGHSTPTLTAKHYLHIGLADLGAAAERIGNGSVEQTPRTGRAKK